jgi:hypothetical protein
MSLRELDDPAERAGHPPAPGGVTRRGGLLGALLVGALVGALALTALTRALPAWSNPFAPEVRDNSQPVVLRSIQDLSRFEAASGNFEVIVDLEADAPFLPDAIRGTRTLFVGAGSVDAYVDFGGLGAEAVRVTGENAAEVRLPHAQLEPATLDTARSRVFSQQRGLLDRLGGFFSDNPGTQQRVYQLAQQKIERAALEGGLRERAEHNTRAMVEGMLRPLGFREVSVRFG